MMDSRPLAKSVQKLTPLKGIKNVRCSRTDKSFIKAVS
jgi:hypothetical protein